MTKKEAGEADGRESTNWQKIRAISFARGFSFLGSELTIFALVLREKESGAATVSVLFILGTLPFILFAPWAGLIADRFSTRRVVLTSSLIQAALIFTLTRSGPHWLVFLTLFFSNTGGAVVNPSWGALIPTLCTKDDLPRAMGFSQSTFALAGLISPALAGFLVSTSGFYWPFAIDSLSFLFIAALNPSYSIYIGSRRCKCGRSFSRDPRIGG
ncbi:MAG: MFS transporter [Actinobacteria bacterium]|nr:MFS transporter [Actinomycetota bacterium]